MHDVAELKLHPVWRQAVQDFLEADVEPGFVVQHKWLESHFGMDKLEDDASLTVAQFRERQFEWLRNLEAFKTELLEEHQICLVSVHGEGYRVVPPAEQTGAAQEKFEREVKRSYRQAALRMKNVRIAELTESQRKENVDAIAKLSMLRGMHRMALE
jgi:hypothetical protein